MYTTTKRAADAFRLYTLPTICFNFLLIYIVLLTRKYLRIRCTCVKYLYTFKIGTSMPAVYGCLYEYNNNNI